MIRTVRSNEVSESRLPTHRHQPRLLRQRHNSPVCRRAREGQDARLRDFGQHVEHARSAGSGDFDGDVLRGDSHPVSTERIAAATQNARAMHFDNDEDAITHPTVHVVDGNREVQRLDEADDHVNAVAWSPDGLLLAAASNAFNTTRGQGVLLRYNKVRACLTTVCR